MPYSSGSFSRICRWWCGEVRRRGGKGPPLIVLGTVVFSSLHGLCSVLPWHSLVAAPCHVPLPSCSAATASALSLLWRLWGVDIRRGPLSSTCGLMMSARIASPCSPRPRFELGLSSRVSNMSANRVRQSCFIMSRDSPIIRHDVVDVWPFHAILFVTNDHHA